jgi:phosphoribosylformylglycinamidine synthase PurS subunit
MSPHPAFGHLLPANGEKDLENEALGEGVIIRAMKATVTVELKQSVLDPQGKAIAHSLSSLGFGGVEDVRAGKLFRITLADSGQPRAELEREVRQMCERLLANTIIENFSYTLEE